MATAKKLSAAPQDEVKQADIPPAPRPTNIEFVGEGAEKIKFTVDPKAKKTVVYADGVVVTSY